MKKTRVLALVLAAVMLLGILPATAGAEEATGMAAWTPFAETVTLKVPVYDRAADGIAPLQDNYWTRWIQSEFGDKYNIKVQYIPIGRTQVMTDYALLASRLDNSLPTILMEYDYPKLTQWYADGYLTAFDMDEFKAIAPTYYQQMVDNDYLKFAQLDGEYYMAAALRANSATKPNWINFYRLDWLEQVGYDHIPVGREEYLDAMKKIKEAGICEYPCGGENLAATGGYQVYGTREWPMDEREWAMYGSFEIPSLSWEAHKKALRNANEEYNLGLTNPEYFLIDNATAKSNFINGKSYTYGAYLAPDMELLISFYQQNPDGKLAVYTTIEDESRKLQADPATGDYPLYRADNPFGMLIGFSSQASADEIKAGMMYMEWMLQPDNLFKMQWGIEGQNFNYVDGAPVTVGDYRGESQMGYNNNKDYWCVAVESRDFGTMYDYIEATSPKGLPQDFTEEIKALYDLNCKKLETGYVINDALFAMSIEAESDYKTSLQNTYKEYHDKLVQCKPEEFDALYDELAQKYLAAGFQEVLDQRAEAYDAGMTTHLSDNQKK